MLQYLIDGQDSLRVEQWTEAPAVYLDHWALRAISENSQFKTRFQAALNAKRGTLMLSWLNLVEFAKVTDTIQLRSAEALVEDVLPNVFFLEINPFTVIEREDRLIAGGERLPPHADRGFLRAFIHLKPDSLKPFTSRNLFTAAREGELVKDFEVLADTVVERVESLRQEFGINRGFQGLVRRLPSGPTIQHGTRYILRELNRTFLVDRGVKFTRNHAIDLLHSVVPVSYCDLVLLDKHWETQVGKVRARLSAAGMSAPLARVFSRRKNGLERFLCELESFDI